MEPPSAAVSSGAMRLRCILEAREPGRVVRGVAPHGEGGGPVFSAEPRGLRGEETKLGEENERDGARS